MRLYTDGENLTPGLHYSTQLNLPRHSVVPCVDPSEVAARLPHGSGIDGDWTLTVTSRGDIRIDGEYHATNDVGYYVGWRDFHFYIRRARAFVAHELRGPCAGTVQITQRPGDVYSTAVVGAGSEHNDYLSETIDYAISDLLTHRSETPVTVEWCREQGIPFTALRGE